MNKQAIITVGGLSVAVEILDHQRVKVRECISNAAAIPVSDWPIAASDIEKRSQAIFEASGAQARRDDVWWCVGKAGLAYDSETCGRYYIRVVPTAAERRAIERGARAEASDGLI